MIILPDWKSTVVNTINPLGPLFMSSCKYPAVLFRNHSALLIFITFFIIFFISSSDCKALPQFAAMSGDRCITCHTAAQGGEGRTAHGFELYKDVGLLGTSKREDQSKKSRSNTAKEGQLSFGFDTRFQSARSHKPEGNKRKVFPMQASVYSSYRVSNMVVIEGSYNAGPKKFNGQQDWTSSVILQSRGGQSQLRYGFFQPSIGIRFDDHTLLTRSVAGADGEPLIPVNYAEEGIEVTWNKLEWLSMTYGSFKAESLAENKLTGNDGTEISLIENSGKRSTLYRAEIRKKKLLKIFNIFFGASQLENGDFSLMNGFAGTGIANHIVVLGEYALSEKKELRETENITVEVMLKLKKALLFYIRGEDGTTNSFIDDLDIETYTRQGAVGAQLFLYPSVEFRPEWRIVETERYKSNRYAFQLHYFY